MRANAIARGEILQNRRRRAGGLTAAHRRQTLTHKWSTRLPGCMESDEDIAGLLFLPANKRITTPIRYAWAVRGKIRRIKKARFRKRCTRLEDLLKFSHSLTFHLLLLDNTRNILSKIGTFCSLAINWIFLKSYRFSSLTLDVYNILPRRQCTVSSRPMACEVKDGSIPSLRLYAARSSSKGFFRLPKSSCTEVEPDIVSGPYS